MILEKAVSQMDSSFLHFISGDKVLTDFSGLSSDLVHPSDEGHILMGENLSQLIKSFNVLDIK
jgi:lysophospholipase L1-like esterase